MSYVRKIEYKIQPEESFQIIKNCAGCGGKTLFHNTNCFRVNANGNKIDVWLIYQCTKCKHTSNLTVYERCKPASIPSSEYEAYLSNSENIALQYGTDAQFFARNKAEVDWSNIKYTIIRQSDIIPIGETEEIQTKRKNSLDSSCSKGEEEQSYHQGDLLVIHNHTALKIRSDKLVAEVLKLTRVTIKGLDKAGIIVVTENKQEHRVIVEIKGEIECEGED